MTMIDNFSIKGNKLIFKVGGNTYFVSYSEPINEISLNIVEYWKNSPLILEILINGEPSLHLTAPDEYLVLNKKVKRVDIKKRK